MISVGAEIEAATIDGATSLHRAAAEGHSEVVSSLIEAGANVDRLAGSHATPLYKAATGGHVKVVRVLLRANENPTLAMMNEARGVVVALDGAASYGRVQVVRELLQRPGIKGAGALVPVECSTGYPRALLPQGGCVRLLVVDAGVDTKHTGPSLLKYISFLLREKRISRTTDATEEQLNGLQGIRRLLMRVEAVHAVSWLWYANPTSIARAAHGGMRKESNTAVSMPVSKILPILGRRASGPGALLRPLCR